MSIIICCIFNCGRLATFRANEEANLSILYDVYMTQASSTYQKVEKFNIQTSLYTRIGISHEWACPTLVVLSEVEDVDATNGA